MDDDIVEEFRHPSSVRIATLLLLVAESPGHGYELVERLKELGFPQRRTGSVYRDLNRLEDEGLVTSSWATAQTRGPARRVYEVTASGRRTLRACAGAALELQRTLVDYISRYKNVAHSRRRPLRATGKRVRTTRRSGPRPGR
jgi:PadR family transcriptional regulator PadR